MKKVFTLVLAILVCAALVFPVLAAEGFVPSITYKGYPDIVRTQTPDGKKAVGVIYKDGEFAEAVGDGCLVIVPVAQAKDSNKITDEQRDQLLKIYDELSNGTMTLPYGDDVDADKMVVRELMEVHLACSHEHATNLPLPGYTFGVTFDLGVKTTDKIVVMTYIDNKWAPAEKVTINSDGSATIIFEDLCPVAIAIEA